MTRDEKIGLAVGIGGAFVLGAALGLLVAKKGELPPEPKPFPTGPVAQPGLNGPPQLPPPSRPSCIECVDKHLGAAWVLLGECRDGYDHRLYAIGHLHEAESESQAFPELHVAIRDARKAYQQSGACPDFEHLAALAAAVRLRS